MPQGQWCQLMNLLDSFDNGRVICLLKHCWLGIVLSNSDLSCLRELDLPCFFVAITSFLTWLSLLEKYQIASDIIRDQADPIYPQLYPVDILPDHILPSPGSLIPSDPHRSRCLSLEAPLVEPLPPRPSPPGVRSYPYGYPYGSLMIIFIIYKKNKSIYIYRVLLTHYSKEY